MPQFRRSTLELNQPQERTAPRLSRAVTATLVVLASWATLSLTQAVPNAASTYYASPSGLPSNDGSFANPLDLATALSSQGPVRPGDTLWLRGGVYRRALSYDSHGDPVIFVSTLSGTAAAPIIVRQYPGERATLDGNLSPTTPVLSVQGTYTWYWGFEITNTNTNRRSTRGDGIDNYGRFNRFINLVIHDTGQGVGLWATTQTDDSHVYGSVISHVGWEGPSRGHGHSVYVQNISGKKTIADNIMFDGFSFGVHAYTESGRIDNIEVRGNITFNHGGLSVTGGHKANILFAGSQIAQNPNVVDNMAYYPAGSAGRNLDANQCNAGAFQNNYLAGGTPLKLSQCTSTSVTGNTTFGPVDATTQVQYPGNTYGTTPAGVFVGIRPNAYEPGRANIAVFNWAMNSTVSVNLAAAGIVVGDSIEVRDAQNYFGAPVFSGVYNGPVTIPMTGLSAASVIGDAPIQPGHTNAQFGAFVVQRVSAGAPPALPTASLTVSPSSITSGQSATLSWTVSGATTMSIDQGIGAVSATGTRAVSPTATTTYTLTAANAAGQVVTRTATVTVTSAAPTQPTASIVATPAAITAGQGSTLTWSTANAVSVSIAPGLGVVGQTGSHPVNPSTTTTYTITATNSAGQSASATATVTVTPAAPAAPTASLVATPPSISSGQSSTLTWTTGNASSVTISPGVGVVGPSGSVTVRPTATTVYSITAVSASGASATATATVAVVAPTSAAATVKLNASPSTVTRGQGAVLSWTSSSASGLSLMPGYPVVPAAGAVAVYPTTTTTYTLTGTNASGQPVTATATVIVAGTTSPSPMPTASLGAAQSTISAGETATLSWSTSQAATVTLSPGIGAVGSTGSRTVNPTTTTTYTLTATNAAGQSTTSTATVTVAPPGQGPTATLRASTATISRGQGTALFWNATNGTSYSLTPGYSNVPAAGGVAVYPTATTTYTFTARDAAGRTTTATATVVVR